MFPELITELLQDGYQVNFSAPGHSMFPTIMANESIVVAPIDPKTVRLKDIILYRTNGQLIAHRVVSIEKIREVSLTTPRSSVTSPLRLPNQGESTLLKRSAPVYASRRRRRLVRPTRKTWTDSGQGDCDRKIRPQD